MIMTHTFNPIEIPEIGKHGLTQGQMTKLQIDQAQLLNFLGETMNKHCCDIRNLQREVYGHQDYPGLKARSHPAPCPQAEKNDRRLWWLLRLLAGAGLIGGGAGGAAFMGWLPFP